MPFMKISRSAMRSVRAPLSKDLIAAADEELYKIKQSRDKSKAAGGHH